MSLFALLVLVVPLLVVVVITCCPLAIADRQTQRAVHSAQRSEVRQRQRLTGEQTARQLIQGEKEVGGGGGRKRIRNRSQSVNEIEINNKRETNTHTHLQNCLLLLRLCMAYIMKSEKKYHDITDEIVRNKSV